MPEIRKQLVSTEVNKHPKLNNAFGELLESVDLKIIPTDIGDTFNLNNHIKTEEKSHNQGINIVAAEGKNRIDAITEVLSPCVSNHNYTFIIKAEVKTQITYK